MNKHDNMRIIDTNTDNAKYVHTTTHNGVDTRGPDVVEMLMYALACSVRSRIAMRDTAVHGPLTCS